MPVHKVTYQARGLTITKPVYRCEKCGEYAHFSFPETIGTKRIRRWYCRKHKP